jgi:hypothetical protein
MFKRLTLNLKSTILPLIIQFKNQAITLHPLNGSSSMELHIMQTNSQTDKP